MNRVFTILCLLLLFFVGRAQNPRVIKQVVVAEYKTWYITQDGKIWSYNNGSALPVQFPIGGLKADTGAGGFNYFRIIDEKGYVWTSKVDNTTHTTRIDNDATGAPFDGNWYIDAYGHAGLTIRADSSVWFFGMDIFSLFHPGGYPYIPMTGANIKPTRLSPVGMKFKKVLFGGSSILGLTTSGQVYQWSNGGSRTPTLIPTPRPATDIFISHLSVAGAIVPDPGEKSGMGYPYIWGFATSMWGGSGPYGSWAKPTSVKALWKMTAPIREISVDWNTIHYIDSLGNMYGSGFNSFGEVGNGEEFINKYNYPGFPGYGWSFTDYENPTGIPLQIGKGVKWKHLYSNNWFGFYKYAMAENDSLYSWGRNKSLALGNGMWNGYAGNAAHPDALNVLKPTMVHPLTAILTEYGFIPPSISAGPNQTVAGPVATLKGTARAMLAIAVRRPAPNGIDTAGYKIVSYQWKQVSGPKGATITNPNAATTTVTGLQKGTYVFNLLTTDNNTGTLSANTTVQVTANSSSDQVQANAGPNQTLTLPANSTTLTGTTQTNGTIASYKWTQTSGPSTAAIGTPAKAQTTVSNLIQGVYKFQLQVTTVLGTLAIATVQVTVDPAPVVVGPPVANAGADQTITLPVNNVNLKGSGTETNGTITAYKWSQASGPSNASLATPAQAQTSAGGLVAGTYVFQLTVTDKKGVTASDKVNIVVKAASVDPGKPGPSTPPATTPPPSTPPPPVYLPIPGTIQAEAYSQKKGAGITGPENTSDVGGGKDIGLLKPGDEVSYNVDVAASGAYSMAVRVAPIFDGASFQLQNAAGYVLVTAHLPNSGGPLWKTLILRVNLPAGRQTLKLVSQNYYRWYFNWMQFSFVTAATVSNIPGVIQAGDYDNTVGAALETTLDTGGGQDAGLDEKDQMSYRVNVNASGAYTVSFRLASPYSGAGFRLMDGKGKTLATIAVPRTGGWQLWKTVSTTVNLTAGEQQTLVIASQYKYPWNIHWMQFVKQTKNDSAYAADNASMKGPSRFNVYPNPATDQVTLDIANPYMGRLDVQVIDGRGMVVRRSELNKGLPVFQAPLSLSGLAPGMYIVRVQGVGWFESRKVLKK